MLHFLACLKRVILKFVSIFIIKMKKKTLRLSKEKCTISLLDLTPFQVLTYDRQILLSIMYVLFIIVVIHIKKIKTYF